MDGKIVLDKLNMLSKISSADCFQVRSVSELRFIRKIGAIDLLQLEQINKALNVVFNIKPKS